MNLDKNAFPFKKNNHEFRQRLGPTLFR